MLLHEEIGHKLRETHKRGARHHERAKLLCGKALDHLFEGGETGLARPRLEQCTINA